MSSTGAFLSPSAGYKSGISSSVLNTQCSLYQATTIPNVDKTSYWKTRVTGISKGSASGDYVGYLSIGSNTTCTPVSGYFGFCVKTNQNNFQILDGNSIIDSGVAVQTGTAYTFEVNFNRFTSTLTFKINGTVVHTNTSSTNVSFNFNFNSSGSGSSGSLTAPTLSIDYYAVKYARY